MEQEKTIPIEMKNKIQQIKKRDMKVATRMLD